MLNFINASLTAVTGFVVLVLSPFTYAEYIDPIDATAHKSHIATHTLQLDITTISSRALTVGERGIVLYSNDQGKNWHQAEVSTSSHLNALYFANDQFGWAVGEDKVIIKTSDSGNNWVRQYDDRNSDLKGPLLDIWFEDEHTGYAVGVYNSLLKTVDGGKTWVSWQEHIENLDEWHLFAIAASENNIYIASESGLIFRSINGGQSFSAVNTGHTGSFHGVITRENADSLDDVLIFGVGGIVMFSRNSGDNWEYIKMPTTTGLSSGMWLSPDLALFTGADGTLLQLDISSQKATQVMTEMGLPLSSVTRVDEERLGLVGLGGIQLFSTELLVQEGSKHE